MHFENTTQLNLQFNDNELSNIFIPLFFILKHLFDILTFLTCLYNFLSLTLITFSHYFLAVFDRPSIFSACSKV